MKHRHKSYIYVMNKYSGCNIVESKVTDAPHKSAPVKKPRRTFLIRLGVAAFAVGIILALHYLPIDALTGVRSALHDVFCYDVFGRTGFGTSVLFG